MHGITFVRGKQDIIDLCSAWFKTGGDIKRVARGLTLLPSRVEKDVARLKSLGVLLDDGKLDPDVEKYLNTVLGNEIMRIVPRRT